MTAISSRRRRTVPGLRSPRAGDGLRDGRRRGRAGSHAAEAPTLPPPLVEFRSHPVRWVVNKSKLSVHALVFAHAGVLIVAALYYLVTQTNPTVKHWWDTTVTPAGLRHDIRDVGEGVLASCLAQAIVWNPFTPSHRRAGRVLRRVQERSGIPIALAAVLAAAAIGAAAFAVGEVILHTLSVHASPHRATGSLWNRVVTLWNSNWDKKALGFAAALVARRPLHVVYDRVQAHFAGRRVAAGKEPKRYHPPVFTARYHHLLEHGGEAVRAPSWLGSLLGTLLVAAAGLAGFGFYVLTYRA